MTYATLEDQGELGLRELLQFPSIDTSIFYPVLLFTIFIVFTLSTFFLEIRRTGKGNILSSLAVAGFVVTAVGTIWSLLGLISVETIVITFVVSLVFQVIYLITK